MNPELVKRDAALAHHEVNYREVLAWLRLDMREMYQSLQDQLGDAAYVTADDAREELRMSYSPYRDTHFPSMNFMGQLFRNGEWEKTGQYIKSRTPGNKGNELPCWRLK